jgi:pyruvate/2-oxoglutarate dehydrogenase complex dihydrolipoamide acyltransferase (E2) component
VSCRQYHNIDVNVAVNSPAGLMVPFVRDTDRKGLLAISQEVKELAGKVSLIEFPQPPAAAAAAASGCLV